MFFQLLFPSDQIFRSQLQLQQALRMICVVKGGTSEEDSDNKRRESRENGILLNHYPHPLVCVSGSTTQSLHRVISSATFRIADNYGYQPIHPASDHTGGVRGRGRR